MKNNSQKKFSPRNDPGKVVILPEAIHHKLKVEATERKLTLTEYVIMLLEKAKSVPGLKGSATIKTKV